MVTSFSSSLIREHIANQCICCAKFDLQKSPAILMPFVSHRALGLAPVMIDANWGLKTIPQGIAYCLCNTLYCEHCNFIFLDIRFSDVEMQRYYNGYLGKDYEELREYYEPGFLKRNKELTSQHPFVYLAKDYINGYLNPQRILDWGGGNGVNTPFYGGSYHVDIYEIGEKKVISGVNSVSKAQLENKKYDLIICRHVLEHVPYPSDVLEEIFQYMREDTFLYIEVPHEALMVKNSQLSSQLKRHWHEHINFFSIKAMQNLLFSCGFEIVNIKSSPIEKNENISSASCIMQAIVKKK